jgi:hypothetical protein
MTLLERISASTAICLMMPVSTAYAGSGYRLAVINEIQTASSAVPNPNVVYIAQSGGWLGSPNCSTGWAYFNAKDNPFFAAKVLAAQAEGRAIRVYVDDSLPKIGDYCQITYISSFPE